MITTSAWPRGVMAVALAGGGIIAAVAGHDYYVGLAAGDDGAGFGGGGDHADGAGHEVGFAADAFREIDLVERGDRNVGVGGVAAGGAIDEIDAEWSELTRERDGLFDIPAAFDPVGGR